MADINELSTKVSVLEAEFDNMVKAIEKLDRNLDNTSAMVFQIKERLDKQNGLIPHMSEDVKGMRKQQKELMDSLTANAVKHSDTSLKVKLLWGGVTALAGALLYALLRIYVG